MSVKDKVAIVTGATGGLGPAVVREFLDAGAKVAALSRKKTSLKSLADELQPANGTFLGLATDVLSEDDVRSSVAQVVETFGRVDCLLNLVGGFLGGVRVPDTSETQMQQMMDLNYRSAFLCCRNVLPVMTKQKYGRIINIGSKGGVKGTAGMSAYSAAKAAVINLTETLASEGLEHNITANAIVPGIIDTQDNREAMPKADFDKWVKPESLARIMLFFCSDEARDISGAVIPVYGKS